jgi:hypothetical protein
MNKTPEQPTPAKLDESNWEAYLDDLLSKPENRLMLVVQQHAQERVDDLELEKKFIEAGRQKLAQIADP